jgi:hypothetical protein
VRYFESSFESQWPEIFKRNTVPRAWLDVFHQHRPHLSAVGLPKLIAGRVVGRRKVKRTIDDRERKGIAYSRLDSGYLFSDDTRIRFDWYESLPFRTLLIFISSNG